MYIYEALEPLLHSVLAKNVFIEMEKKNLLNEEDTIMLLIKNVYNINKGNIFEEPAEPSFKKVYSEVSEYLEKVVSRGKTTKL